MPQFHNLMPRLFVCKKWFLKNTNHTFHKDFLHTLQTYHIIDIGKIHNLLLKFIMHRNSLIYLKKHTENSLYFSYKGKSYEKDFDRMS